jgi:flagellar hook-length control protein FliK
VHQPRRVWKANTVISAIEAIPILSTAAQAGGLSSLSSTKVAGNGGSSFGSLYSSLQSQGTSGSVSSSAVAADPNPNAKTLSTGTGGLPIKTKAPTNATGASTDNPASSVAPTLPVVPPNLPLPLSDPVILSLPITAVTLASSVTPVSDSSTPAPESQARVPSLASQVPPTVTSQPLVASTNMPLPTQVPSNPVAAAMTIANLPSIAPPTAAVPQNSTAIAAASLSVTYSGPAFNPAPSLPTTSIQTSSRLTSDSPDRTQSVASPPLPGVQASAASTAATISEFSNSVSENSQESSLPSPSPQNASLQNPSLPDSSLLATNLAPPNLQFPASPAPESSSVAANSPATDQPPVPESNGNPSFLIPSVFIPSVQSALLSSEPVPMPLITPSHTLSSAKIAAPSAVSPGTVLPNPRPSALQASANDSAALQNEFSVASGIVFPSTSAFTIVPNVHTLVNSASLPGPATTTPRSAAVSSSTGQNPQNSTGTITATSAPSATTPAQSAGKNSSGNANPTTNDSNPEHSISAAAPTMQVPGPQANSVPVAPIPTAATSGAVLPAPQAESATPAASQLPPAPPPNPASAAPELPPTTPASPGPVQMAQMVTSASQSEMRIGLNTSAFGNVEVHTVVHAGDVGLSVGSEKGDLHSFLSNELPTIANSLQQQSLRLSQVNFHQGSGLSGNLSSGGGSQQQRFASPTSLSPGLSAEESPEVSPESAGSPALSRGASLSILA